MVLWVDTGAADAYFATRFGAAAVWTADTDKTAALTTAQNMILASRRFVFSSAEIATPTEAMANGLCEQTLFLLRDPKGIEARAGLQAQGVSEAGIVQEKYWRGQGSIPIAPMAEGLLAANATGGNNTFPWER